jgi:hypothetical protein
MRKLFLITALFILSPFMYANIFFDDFDGDDLADWWVKSEGTTQWDYEVSDSMLKVKRLWGGPFEWSQIHLKATLPAFNDFEMTAKVGWDAGLYQILRITIENSGYETPDTGWIAYYNEPNKTPYVKAVFNSLYEGYTINAPSSGMHEFRFVRHNKILYAFFNGESLGIFSDKFPFSTTNIKMTFVGKDTDEFAPLYVDMVQVVPEPISIVVISLGATYAFLKRRK